MTEKVTVPHLGESITEATIGSWLKAVGDVVEEDEAVAELETDKVAVEVNAPVAGTLKSILVKEGETVEIGAVIGEIEPGDGKPAAKPAVRSGAIEVCDTHCRTIPSGRTALAGDIE